MPRALLAPQFILEFLIESVETLKHIASPTEPPLGYQEILKKIEEFAETDDKTKLEKLKASLSEMDKVYLSGQGDLDQWRYELLDAIDAKFVDNFMVSGEPINYLFTINCVDYLNKYNKYRMEVDDLLIDSKYCAPTHAREYFQYSTLWEMRGYKFPIPLGTKSVIECLNKLASARRMGFEEVSVLFSICHSRRGSREWIIVQARRKMNGER